jgi:hypothetical protein
VFLDLVTEIERQGVARKVVADMFGLALRSYQQKVQRLSESETEPGRTLWEAVYTFLKDREVATRADILARFGSDDDASIKSILNDLVESGLVFRTGRGHSTVFRLATDEDLSRSALEQAPRALQAALWVRIYRQGPVSKQQLSDGMRTDSKAVEAALGELVADGRVSEQLVKGEPMYSSQQCLLAMDDPQGWEAALVDHFQMVTAAICTKLRNGNTRALPDEEVGGSSFSFDVWAGHPAEERVRSLLASTRAQVGALWTEVSTYNRQHASMRSTPLRVNFYFGQGVTHMNGEAEAES